MVLKGTPDTGDYLLKTVIVISLVNCVLSKALNVCSQLLTARQMILRLEHNRRTEEND